MGPHTNTLILQTLEQVGDFCLSPVITAVRRRRQRQATLERQRRVRVANGPPADALLPRRSLGDCRPSNGGGRGQVTRFDVVTLDLKLPVTNF